MRDEALKGCLNRASLADCMDLPSELCQSIEGGEGIAAFTARAYEVNKI